MARKFKTYTGLKVYTTIISLLLIVAIILTGCAFGLGWVQLATDVADVDQVQDDTDEEAGEEVGGMVIETGESESDSGVMALSMAKLSVNEYEDYGIDLLSTETAYMVSLTVNPEYYADTYIWTCTNTSEISLTVSGTTKYCIVTCSGAFGTQAILTVQSSIDSDVSATCTIDYVKRVSSVAVSLSTSTINMTDSGSTSYTITATPTYGTGTITPTFTVNGGTLVNNIEVTTILSNSSTNSSGVTTRYYRSADTEDYTFTGTTFTVTNPYDMFVSSTSEYSTIVYAPVTTLPDIDDDTTYPTEEELKTVFNNSFILGATGTTSDLTLTINYTVSYTPSGDNVQGSYSESGSCSLGVASNVSGLTRALNSWDIDTSAIVFSKKVA